MKNDGKIGNKHVRKEIYEKQFSNLKIILRSLSGFAASCYLNLHAPVQCKSAVESPVLLARNQGIYY